METQTTVVSGLRSAFEEKDLAIQNQIHIIDSESSSVKRKVIMPIILGITLFSLPVGFLKLFGILFFIGALVIYFGTAGHLEEQRTMLLACQSRLKREQAKLDVVSSLTDLIKQLDLGFIKELLGDNSLKPLQELLKKEKVKQEKALEKERDKQAGIVWKRQFKVKGVSYREDNAKPFLKLNEDMDLYEGMDYSEIREHLIDFGGRLYAYPEAETTHVFFCS